ncbi:hypothetical protein H072_6813 [Dactylellina haptotyla CBS 200.50]|uniref:Uncharacterized protein n=1 Tax=Dactylellina haptotyla (strain CBS 200.50) TaxID=1284197 RepID=S8A8S3_DACHA|nr:hypothetical protein H072_6813 [Dactylellina haptotyla CBS 200.50]
MLVQVTPLLFLLGIYFKGAASQLDEGGVIEKGDAIWTILAERGLGSDLGPSGQIDPNKLRDAAETIYIDYTRYLSDIGHSLTLVNFEYKMIADKKKKHEDDLLADNFCTVAQLREWESYSMNALDSSLSGFVSTYCGIPCRVENEFWSTPMNPISCVDEATALFEAYDCITDPRIAVGINLNPTSGFSPFAARFSWDSRLSPLEENPIEEHAPLNEPAIVEELQEPPDLHRNPVLSDELPPILGNGFGQIPLFPVNPPGVPISHSEPRSVKEKVSRKVYQCKKAAEDSLITTFAPPPSFAKIDDHFDPMWISTPIEPGLIPDGDSLLKDQVDASHCKTADDSSSDLLTQLDMAYQAVREEKFMHYFGRYHIWTIGLDNDEKVELTPDSLASEIKSSTDAFFSPIIQGYDPLLGLRPCAEESDGSPDGSITSTKYAQFIPEADNPNKKLEVEDLTGRDSPFDAFTVTRFIGVFLDTLSGTESLGTDDAVRPEIWDKISDGKVVGAELATYARNLQTRCPGGYSQFIQFLRENKQHVIVDTLAKGATIFISPGGLGHGAK